jgi:uroporphyrinogen-III synthase
MLKGLNVLLTRENNDNIILAEKIVELGGRAFNCPLLSIVPIDTIGIKLDKPPDIVIFVSKNAVLHFFTENLTRNNSPIFRALNFLKQESYFLPRIAAIGITTKNLLEQYGCTNIIYPRNRIYNSDSLLIALQEEMDIKSKTITIIKGVDGLPDLKNNLVEQGANVQEVSVYKRILPKQAAQNLHEICISNNISIILVTSEFILDAIFKLTHNKIWFDKSKICLVVPSERVASLSVKMGFRQVITATNVTHAEIMQTLISYHTGVCYAR